MTIAQDDRRIRLCGTVEIARPDGTVHAVAGAQPQLVLAYLLVEDRPVQRDELADLLWDGPLPDHWAGAVRGLTAKVRAALVTAGLPDDCLVAQGGLVSLHLPAGVTVDVREAGAAVDGARAALAQGAPDRAVALARLARDALRSLFLPRADGPWVRLTRERLDELGRLAAQHEIEGLLGTGDPPAAIARAEEAVATDPLDENAHHLLLRALLADGQQVRALAAHERLRSILAAEFGIRPAAATEALVRDLLDAPAPAAPAPGPSGARVGERADAGPHDLRFVGRADELDRLVAARDDVRRTGRARVVVVAGEAGIGKTRLALELARGSGPEAVLWGRCRVDAGLPYEPVAEALLDVLGHDGGARLGRLGPAAAGLRTLLPELAPGDDTTDAAPADAGLVRAQLFRSVTAVVRDLADGAPDPAPLLWVVDDLQWASDDTLTLLEHVLDAVAAPDGEGGVPVLVVLTVRDAPPAIEAALARLQRRAPLDTVALTGLDATDIAPLLDDLLLAGDTPTADADALARAIADRTGGNPFFVTEIAREAGRPGAAADPHAIPAAVREWIERRAASLPPATAALLDLAAVVGLEVDFDVLLASHPVDEATLLDRADELVRAGLLHEVDEGRFAFPHAITRDVVYEAMGPTRRTRLHRRVAGALVDVDRSTRRSAVLAHHFARAGQAHRGEAYAHAMAAGRESLDQAAWSLAASQLRLAADLAEDLPADRDRARAASLAQLGRALHGAGDADAARGALEEAIGRAREHDLPVELATAVLHLVGGGGRGVAVGLPDATRAALLREALDGLVQAADDGVEGLDALAGAVEGELALALLLTDRVDERERLVRRALDRARATAAARGGPDASLAQALLDVRIARQEPDDVARCLADADEVLALPSSARTAEQTIAAHVLRHEDLLRLGRRDEARRALERATALADEHAHPYWRWATATWWALDAIVDGRLDEAEALAFDATTRQIGDHPEAGACLGVNLIDIRLYQGRSGELLDLVADAADDNPHIPCYRAVLSLCALEAGARGRAADAYDRFAADAFASIPRDTNRLLTLAVLAHAAVALGRTDDEPALSALLTPYAGQQVVLNCFGGGGAAWGPVAHQLGRLARLAGRDDEAEAHLSDALAQATSFGAPLAVARVRDDLVTRVGGSR